MNEQIIELNRLSNDLDLIFFYLYQDTIVSKLLSIYLTSSKRINMKNNIIIEMNLKQFDILNLPEHIGAFTELIDLDLSFNLLLKIPDSFGKFAK